MSSDLDGRILVLGGYHEPLAFWQRRGGWYADVEQRHEAFFSQATVDRFTELGVTTTICPGYKGLGLKIESREWDNLKRFRPLLERAGIELGVYLQCGSFYAETFYDEHPPAREWTATDFWGKPHPYSEHYRCYWRHRPCLTHRAFSEYTANIAQRLVKECGATYFNADNNAQMPCYTDRFRDAFHRFLKAKYRTETADGLATFTRRYGHANVDNIVLPSGSARKPIEALHTLMDPGLQDWVEFRCRLVAQNAAIIAAATKAANPNARLSFNISYDYGEFHQLVWGTEPEFIAPYSDFIFSEDGNQPRVTDEGRLISHVHTCKHIRSLGTRGNFHAPHVTADLKTHEPAVTWLMEMAIHNQGSLGYVYQNDFDLIPRDPRPATIRFIREHEDVFTRNSTIAEIAVLRSRHSGTINWAEATEGRLLAQQSLFQAGFQWDNVTESATAAELARYRLLVLPETISVPTNCLRQIAEYVRGVGRVLAVGGALACDEWGNRRPKSSATALFGESDAGFGSFGASRYATAVLAAWLGVEDSCTPRLTAFPRLQHPKPFVWDPGESRSPVLNFNHHALPLNSNDFIGVVRDALAAPLLVEAVAADRDSLVIPTLLRSNQTGAVSLHVLNYRLGRRVEPTTVRINLPELAERAAAGATLITLDDKPSQLPVTRDGAAVTLRLPSFNRYAGVLFRG